MLERATAYVESRSAQESLRCLRKAARSKRLLHSAFWNHGAGDLDLPPWMLSPHSPPPDLPLRHHDRGADNRSSELGKSAQTHTQSLCSSDRTFLSFLYPPQALAWLQRTSHQQRQRWESRNVRRLPEGFIVASRVYSSRSQVKSTLPPLAVAIKEQEDDPGMAMLEKVLRRNSMPNTPHRRSNVRAKSRHLDRLESREEQPARHNVPQDPTSHNPVETFAPFHAPSHEPIVPSFQPSPAVETLPEIDYVPLDADSFADTMKKLRNIMTFVWSNRVGDRAKLLQSAIKLFKTLQQNNEQDSQLIREMLHFLSLYDSPEAQMLSIEIHQSLPVGQRNLQTYQAVLPACLAQNSIDAAISLHQEALNNLENGYQISQLLFRHALDKWDWKMAMRIEKDHRERYTAIHQTKQIRVFWLHVSEIPHLLSKAQSLAKYLGTNFSNHRAMDDHERNFVKNFVKEAFDQEFLQADAMSVFDRDLKSKLHGKWLRLLLDHLSRLEDKPAKLFEDLLLAMLSSENSSHYFQFHHLISWMYQKYRKLDAVSPPERMFAMWLNRLTENPTYLTQSQSNKRSNMSIKELTSEWEHFHQKVSLDGLKRLMVFFAKFGQLTSYEHWLEYLRINYPSFEDQQDILWTMVWVHAKRADLDSAQSAFAQLARTTAEHHAEPDAKSWNMLLQAHSRADDLQGALINLQNFMNNGSAQPDNISFHTIAQMLARRGEPRGVENLLDDYRKISQRDADTALLSNLLLAHVNNDDVLAAQTILEHSMPQIRNGTIRGSATGCFNILLTAYAKERDMKAVLDIYKWMKEEGVNADLNSYAALMQALVNHRQTSEAHTLLKQITSKNKLKPTSFHYAILLAGYVNNRQPEKALELFENMKRRNIKRTVLTNIAYLRAKATIERDAQEKAKNPGQEPIPLQETIKALDDLLQEGEAAVVLADDPAHGLDKSIGRGDAIPAAYFQFLIMIHGQQGCLSAAQELFKQYFRRFQQDNDGQNIIPLGLVEALATMYLHDNNFSKVEECWTLAKKQADRISPPAPIATMMQSTSTYFPNASALGSMLSSAPGNAVLPFENHGRPGTATSATSALFTPSVSRQHTLSYDQNYKKQEIQQRSPARSHILSRILHLHVRSLIAQKRTLEAVEVIMQVMNEGYTLSSRTWNTFISSLCQEKQPLTLLAFVFAERFLTPNFPGYLGLHHAGNRYPRPEDRSIGFEHLKARYVPPTRSMPRYRTLVWLARALVHARKARRKEKSDGRNHHILEELTGDFASIERLAPKTFRIVQRLPKLYDKIQSKLLENE